MLENLLREHQSAIAERWLDLMLQAYPPETAMFLKENRDPFTNPVGTAFRRGVEGITDCFARKARDRELAPLLDEVMQIGAVQDMAPSQFLRFLFFFKEAIRTELAEDAREGRVGYEELASLEARIDDMMLLAFDSYVEHREKLYEVRVKQLQDQTYRLLERAGMVAPTVEFELGGEGGSCCPSTPDPSACGSCTACDGADDE